MAYQFGSTSSIVSRPKLRILQLLSIIQRSIYKIFPQLRIRRHSCKPDFIIVDIRDKHGLIFFLNSMRHFLFIFLSLNSNVFGLRNCRLLKLRLSSFFSINSQRSSIFFLRSLNVGRNSHRGQAVSYKRLSILFSKVY